MLRIFTKEIKIKSKHEADMIDITKYVEDIIRKSNLRNGIVNLFTIGSTAAITTIEYEPGLVEDFASMLERIIPKGINYEHQERWHDNNGHSHVRASLIGPSLTIPFVNGKLALGIWQQIVFLELDIRPRSRTVVAQLIGE